MYHRRPSDDLEVSDTIAAYCLDKAVLTWGIIVENALAETVEVGMGKDKRREAKYTLEQLLEPTFTLPRPLPTRKAKQPMQSGFAVLLALAGQPGSNVKRWEYVKPS